MQHADIVVVGAGPAGAAAAICTATAGLRTVLLDGDCAVDEQPGETLHPGVERLFRELGVESAVKTAAKIRHEGHWSETAQQRRFLRFGGDRNGSWRGFQIRRNDLRQILLNRADQVGVSIRRERATKPIVESAKVCGVETRNGAVGCRILIDASGGVHWSARATRERIDVASSPLVAWYGWARSPFAARFAAPVFAMDGAGWTWIAQVDFEICAWVRLRFSQTGTERLGPPPQLAEFDIVGRERGADVTWRIAATHAGEGFFRVGDAGAVLDPGASHGVLRAIMTGMVAARYSFQILKLRQEASAKAASYDQWIKQSLNRDVSILRKLYRTYATAGEPAFASPAVADQISYGT
jgi:flavin-dependent dehydrogenase